MRKPPLASAVAFIRRVASAGIPQVSNGDLVHAFHADDDKEAFATLVDRHRPLVWSVCQRVLGNAHDAEDAFQATFLVLARNAGSIHRREAIASWLYGVAYRTAIKTRCKAARRHTHERRAAAMPKTQGYDREIWQELQPVVDAELNELPRRYRDPIVLCHLQEKSRAEVARQLGCGVGTLKSRLSRGLEKLRARLVRRGVEVSTCVLGAVLVEKAAAMSVAMPPRLATSTVKAALWFAAGKDAALGSIPASVAAVAESVSKPLLLSKLMKIGAVVLLALGALATIGAVGSRMSGGLDSADSAKLSHPRTETSDAKLDKLVKDVAELRSEVRAARPHDPFTPPPVEAREETRDFKNARVEVVVKSIFDLEDGVAAGKRKDDAASLRVQKLMAELALAKEELERRMNGLPETVRRAVEKYQERMTELREANQRALDGQQVRGVKKKLKRAEKAKMWIWAAEVRAGMLTEADARRWMDRDEIEEPKPKLLREVRK